MDQKADKAVKNRIHARACAIWEREGRPEHRGVEHWMQAVRELREEDFDDLSQPLPAVGRGQIIAPTPPQGRC